MKVDIITVWYNEEFFSEYFLNHYSWADNIHILLDNDTNDLSEPIAKLYPNTVIEHINFPDGFDDSLKAFYITSKYNSITEADYIIIADADEFIFCYDLSKTVLHHLCESNKDVYFVNLWQIYKHESEVDLDPALPVYQQRKHGDPNMEANQLYIKPMIIRSGGNLEVGVGHHSIKYNGNYLRWSDIEHNNINVAYTINDMFQGSHWRLVDIQETINRRINNRKQRLSQYNIINGFTTDYLNVTEDDIFKEYEMHKHDPVLFNI